MTAKTASNAQTAATGATPPRCATGINLEPAATAVGASDERRIWLDQMQEPGGMSPGSSCRAHARAFRFAEALGKAGYRVLEGPYGPRGGRRFILASYDGPRAAVLFQLKSLSDCTRRHNTDDCPCFDDLSDDQLAATRRLTRLANRPKWGTRYGSDRIAKLVRTWAMAELAAVTALYANAGGTRQGGPTIEELLELVRQHGLVATTTALNVYTGTCRPHDPSPTVAELAAALAVALTPGHASE